MEKTVKKSHKMWFNSNYEGNKRSKRSKVNYFQLLQDLKEMVFDSFLLKELFVHFWLVIFLLVFISTQLNIGRVQDTESSLDQLLLKPIFPDSSGSGVSSFSSIRSEPEVVQYIMNVLYRGILDPNRFMHSAYGNIKTSQVLLWGIRFRAIDVVPGQDCQWNAPPIDFATGQSTDIYCNTFYSTSTRSESRPDSCYPYTAATNELTFQTKFGSYPGSGFVQDINIVNETTVDSDVQLGDCTIAFDKRHNNTILQTLLEMFSINDGYGERNRNYFIQRNTVFLIVSMTLYIPNTNMLAYPRLAFEFLPTGLINTEADINIAPYSPVGSENAVFFALGVVLTIIIPIRLLFQILYFKNLSRVRKFRMKTHTFPLLMEMLLAALQLLVLIDIISRNYVRSEANVIQTAIAEAPFYVGVGSYVYWWNTMQYIYSYTLLFCVLFFVKYFRLFWGLRALWCVGFVAFWDLLAFYFLAIMLIVAFGLALNVLFGPYAIYYYSVVASLEATLLQVVGYFSQTNVNYASKSDLVIITAVYLALFIIMFILILLNTYISIILKAFGIVFNLQFHQTGDQLVRPELRNTSGGIRVTNECKYWCLRNRALGKNCCSNGDTLLPWCLSVCCCRNNNKEKWLSTSQIIEKLILWRRKEKNQDVNFLSFKQLREALSEKNFNEVNNFQVDYLFSICTLTLSNKEADRVTEIVSGLIEHDISTKDYVLAKMRDEKSQQDVQDISNTNQVLHEFKVAYDTLVELKRKQAVASIKLDQRIDSVVEHQRETLEYIRQMTEAVTDLNNLPQ